METLAYLHQAQEFESPEDRELNLKGIKGKAAVGLLAVVSATGVLSMTDVASAYPCGGYYGYYSYRPYYNCYRPYYRPYYSSYYYQPYYYNPCY